MTTRTSCARAKEAAKRTYSQSVAVTKECMDSVRMGQAPNIKKIKRVVQTIVDQILNEETSLIGLTTIRDYDEYTFTHCVNVCIFSVALGRRLGLAQAAALRPRHGGAVPRHRQVARAARACSTRPTDLSDDEWRWLAAHPWLGVLALFQMRGLAGAAVPRDGRGVRAPHEDRPDRVSADDPAARRRASSARSSRSPTASTRRRRAAPTRRVPMSPAAVLAGDARQSAPRHGPGRREGVHQPDRRLSRSARSSCSTPSSWRSCTRSTPIRRRCSRARRAHRQRRSRQRDAIPGTLADLAEQIDDGVFRRTIIKTENPDRYGISVGDYFL